MGTKVHVFFIVIQCVIYFILYGLLELVKYYFKYLNTVRASTLDC